MARPKQSEQQISSQDRIEDAFLKLLAELPYENITIKALAKEAGVNHNLIYYYYDNIDDIAQTVFDRSLQLGLPQLLLGTLVAGEVQLLPEIAEQFAHQMQKTRLYAGSNSSFLVSMFKKGLKDTWLSQIGKAEAELSELDKIKLEFIFSGLTSIIGFSSLSENPQLIPQILREPIGHAMVQTMLDIAEE